MSKKIKCLYCEYPLDNKKDPDCPNCGNENTQFITTINRRFEYEDSRYQPLYAGRTCHCEDYPCCGH